MPEAFIVDAVRTPVGKRGGGLAAVHPADLGGSVLTALVERTGIDPGAVEDVVFGCVDTVGPQAGDIARTAWLVAGLPEHVPGTTVDRQCGSSQQAVHFAAQAVMSGTADVVVAGGVQNMSAVPISYAMIAGQALGFPDPFSGSPGWQRRYGDQEISQFRSAEMIAEKWDISREDMERFAVTSHERALRAAAEGRFGREIAPVFGLTVDEPPRQPDWAKIRSLPALVEGGRLHRRRGRRTARGERGRAAGARADASRPDPSHVRPRRRSGVDADRADTGHRERAGQDRADAGRHRPRRDQRGLRVGGARLGRRDRR
jgi:acetyl-CoA C-acetyltransferase